MTKRVAFQGARGAFSEQAAQRLAGDDIDLRPHERFEQIFHAVRDGAADYAVVPIENTLFGSVHENYDHLRTFQLPIVAEARLRIQHNLMVLPGTQIDHLRRVISHPVALGQCLEFFRRHPQLVSEAHYDTAGSVADMMQASDRSTAAIGSALAAECYGAEILEPGIEDDHQNYTRFFLVASEPGPEQAGSGTKTSIVFTVKNETGVLFRCLAAFALRDINMTKLESRPFRGRPWEYLFYLDFLGSPAEERVDHALRHLSELTDEQVILGCYTAAAIEGHE